MKRAFSNLVTVFCLLAFFVSSAACLAVEPPQQTAHEISMHSIGAPSHACCPRGQSAHQMTSACCTVHHQPASFILATELHEDVAPVFAAFVPPSLSNAASPFAAFDAAPVPPQLPPLIALRI